MHQIVNDAALAYKGAIPKDRWKEPYMPKEELRFEIADGVQFWGYIERGRLLGIMGIQDVKGRPFGSPPARGMTTGRYCITRRVKSMAGDAVKDVTLIRHAYVLTSCQGRGIGSQLLMHLARRTKRPLLIGTWKAARWAIRFYQNHGFQLVAGDQYAKLLFRYWKIPKRQVATSVVLADKKWFHYRQKCRKNISVILAHPNKKSFNHAIAQAVRKTLAQNGYTVHFHDLYQEKFRPFLERGTLLKGVSLFDPLLERHCQEISNAAGIIIVHPNWWGQPPAILKGWVDRVIRAGVAYQFSADDSGQGVPAGLLFADTAVVFNTSDTPQAREMRVFGDPLQTLWGKCIFNYCGVKNFYRKTFGVVVTSTLSQRKAWLGDVKKTIQRQFPPLQ